MPYAEQHINDKGSAAKRNRSQKNLCPCKNCRLKCTQTRKIVTRHLEVFGRYTGYDDDGCESSESGSDDAHISAEQELEIGGGDLRLAPDHEPLNSSEESGGRDHKRLRTDSQSSSEESDGHSIHETGSGVEDLTDHFSDHFESTDNAYDSQDNTSFASSSDEDCEPEEHNIYDGRSAKVPLFENSDVAVLEALASYFMWFTEHPSTSKRALSDLLRLNKRLLPQPNNLPGSYDEAFNFIKPFLLPIEIYHVCPNDCVIFRKTSRYDYSKLKTCPVCGSDRYWGNKNARRRFPYFPLGPRWRRMYGDANISQVMQSHTSEYNYDTMHDIHDSPSWKKAFSEGGFSNGDPRGMLLQLSTDGVNPFSNNKVNYSMWPIMISVLNLPRSVRNLFQNIMLTGIVPAQTDGQEPKSLDPYLEMVVDEILELSGATFFDDFAKAPFTFKVALLNYVLDYPGLGKVFTTAGAAALQGCMWCEIRGKFVSSLDKVVYLENRRYLPGDHPLREGKKPFPDPKPEKRPKPNKVCIDDVLRNSVAHSRAKNKAQASNVTKATGSRGVNCFMLLPNHDRPNQAFPDMMHDLKNVVCTFFDLITGKGDSVKVRKAEKELGRFKGCWPEEKQVVEPEEETTQHVKIKAKQKTSKQDKSKTKKNVLSDAPFRLSAADLTLADKRALNVCVPTGYGWKPCAFFRKKPYLKSHDWKQLAVDGILKFCLRGMLGHHQRNSLFHLFDVLTKICSDSQDLHALPALEQELNEVCAKIERDFPISIQTISLHILRHSVAGIQQLGPIHSWWMYCYERFNSWICQRVKNRRFPEATVMETYRIFDWVHYMSLSGRLVVSFDSGAGHGGESKVELKTGKPGTENYQPTTQEIKDLEVYCVKTLSSASSCMQLFSIEKKLVGKTHVWKSHTLDSPENNCVSSVVQVNSGENKCVGRIVHFLILEDPELEGSREFVTVQIFKQCQRDPYSCLYFADKSSFHQSTVPLEFISCPLVTAPDDEKESILWLLNIS